MPARPQVLYSDRRLWLRAQPITGWNDGLQALARDVLDPMTAVAVGVERVCDRQLHSALRIAPLHPRWKKLMLRGYSAGW